eukprot:COSAG01_NODE_43162_length_432_cov_3.270270_1_plen_39_part_10
MCVMIVRGVRRYAVTVKNTGSVAGDEVVQAYWTPPPGGG